MSMQAIHLPDFVSDPSTLVPSTVPRPKPRDDQYTIRITHCSPQHADILYAQGKHQNNNRKHGHVFPPFVLGIDFAGVVVSVPISAAGATLAGWKPKSEPRVFAKGDRVIGQSVGSFAEYICARAEEMRKVPARLSNEIACAMVGQTVSYASVVNVAKVQKGETVLVSGASGGLGSVCCMVAKAVGAKVLALAGDQEKAQLMRENLDADAVIVQDSEGAWITQVMEITQKQGVDVVLDNTGMVNDAIKCLAHFGRIIVLGFAARKGIMEEVKMNKILLKDITLVGYRFGETGRRRPEELERIWDQYLEMLSSGRMKPSLYGRYDGLQDMGRALKDLHDRKVFGKIVVPIAPEQEEARL